MDERQIGKYRWSYITQALITLVVLDVGGYALGGMWLGYAVLLPLLVSSLVFLTIELSDILLWSRIVKKVPENLPTFFMGVSGFRMLLCVLVFFIYYFTAERQAMLIFLCIFALFYVAMLAHHALFFSHDKSK